jgi:hypothetical protein
VRSATAGETADPVVATRTPKSAEIMLPPMSKLHL